MRVVAGFGLGALAMVTILGVDLAAGMRTASAQGGIVCDYGTSRYKRCCRDSYRDNPDLGPRARARDIDACMKGRDRDRDSSEQPDRNDRKSQKAKEDRGGGGGASPATLRRLDCAQDGCQGGCGEDEVAVSAFCPSGAPTADGDRDVKCAQGRERPAVLVCSKR